MSRLCLLLLPALMSMLSLCCCSEDNTRADGDFGTLSVSIDVPQGLDTAAFVVTVADAQGRTASWPYSDFPQEQKYLTGAYVVTATLGSDQEGLGLPYYSASSTVTLSSGQELAVELSPSPRHAQLKVEFSAAFASRFPAAFAILHCREGAYVDYPQHTSATAWLAPGHTDVLLAIPLQGRTVTFRALTIPSTSADSPLTVRIDASGENVTATCASASHTTTVDQAFLSAPVPEATPHGFRTGQTLTLPEGDVPGQGLWVDVASETDLESVTLTVNSPSLHQMGVPALMEMLPQMSAHGGRVELDSLVARLVYLDAMKSRSTFTVMATDRAGRMSLPVTLEVDTRELSVEITQVPAVLVGADRATVCAVATSTPDISNIEIQTSLNGRDWSHSRILQVTPLAQADAYEVEFAIPAGNQDVRARFLYCDEVRGRMEVRRVSPRFSIAVDAYATSALVKIIPEVPSQLQAIVDYARILANGQPLTVASRQDSGYIAVTGLRADGRYEFTATTLPQGPGVAPEVTVRTESVAALPNGDFEDMDTDIDCESLPSGGRYSQNSVEIFNRQNRRSFKVETPRKWATTNPATFWTGSRNLNTWYMQPSAIGTSEAKSGGRAVMLVSVAHDPDGEPIPDYLQRGTPYLDYSPVVPHIAYRTSGKLFLGSLRYDATEGVVRRDGIPFSSRPRSLNGFYKYEPSLSDLGDQGVATVEVYGKGSSGKEVLIGSGRQNLAMALGYTAFSVEIDYHKFGLKATRLCVEMRSSLSTPVTVDDPVTASSTGSRLWLDNISLAY